MKLSNEVLLALAYVSQISDPDSAKDRFLESLNSLDDGFAFKFFNRLPDGIPEHLVMPIATIRSSFGYAVMSESSQIVENVHAVLRNAFQFLAVLLENRDQAKKLQSKNESFRKDAEAALSANYTLMQIAGETAKFGGWSVDLSNNICTWSEKIADIHDMLRGYSPPVKDAINFYAPEWRDKITQVFTDCVEKGISYDEAMEIITRKGKRVWVRTTGQAVRNGTGKIVKVQGSFQDITESKQSAETIKESETKFRNLFENSTIGKSLTNLDGNILVNKAFCKIIGYSEEELKRIKWTDITHPDDLQISNDIIQSLRDGKISVGRFEKRYIHKNGNIVWVDISTYLQKDKKGEPQYFITSVLDITEGKRIEKQLRDSEKKFQYLFNNAQVALFRTSIDGKLIEINKRYAKVAGYSSIEDCIAEFNAAQAWYDPNARKALLATLKEKGSVVDYEIKIIPKDGTSIWILFSAMLTKQGYIEGSLIDITDRKQAEEHLRAAQVETTRLLAVTEHSREELLGVVEDLQAAEGENRRLNVELEQRVRDRTTQLEATNKELEAFTYSVSHDLRAPLRSMDGFSLALLEDYADKLDDQGKDFLNRIRSSSTNMAKLIDGLLDLSRLTRESMIIEDINLTDIVKKIMAELKNQQPERNLESLIQPELKAKGDARLIQAVMENLLGNAWKFSAKRNPAKIEFGLLQNRNKEEVAGNGDEEIRHEHQIENLQSSELIYFVCDNGAGFDMKYADKLFGVFQRLHRADEFPGTGVGLATVERVITRHGGRIWAEGKEGEGATFYFTMGT
jgi:PAS domain S-box-containing protein